MLISITVNHDNTRLMSNRGLAVGGDAKGGLGLRGKGDSALLETIDKKMVRNLFFSQKYFSWGHLLAFTCSQSTYFGTASIKKCVDEGLWKSIILV